MCALNVVKGMKLYMKEILNKINRSWPKDLIIRYLYIKLAPFFQRDLLYFLVTEEEKERQYKQGFINRFPNIVCSTLADFYVNLFNQYGINAKKIIANSAKIPLYAVIVEGDNGYFYIDPLNDLFYNQYGLKPFFFGNIPHYKTLSNNYKELIKLPYEYIQELDKYLNFNFLDKLFNQMHETFTDRKLANSFFGYPENSRIDLKENKILFYEKELINIGNVNGPFERAQLYKYLNDRLLNHSERKYTKVCLIDINENPHIALELINRDGSILFEERKRDGKYVLVRK